MIAAIERAIAVPTADRLFYVGDAIRSGISLARINHLTGIHVRQRFVRQSAPLLFLVDPRGQCLLDDPSPGTFQFGGP